MTYQVAEQIPITEDSELEAYESYKIPELGETDELNGVLFQLPYSPQQASLNPVLCIYGKEGASGYFFHGESSHHETVFGLEGPEETEALESGGYPVSKVQPFLGRQDDMHEGLRHYTLPLNSEQEYDITADIRPDNERDKEKILIKGLENDNMISQMLIGRTGNGWDFISTKLDKEEEEL